MRSCSLVQNKWYSYIFDSDCGQRVLLFFSQERQRKSVCMSASNSDLQKVFWLSFGLSKSSFPKCQWINDAAVFSGIFVSLILSLITRSKQALRETSQWAYDGHNSPSLSQCCCDHNPTLTCHQFNSRTLVRVPERLKTTRSQLQKKIIFLLDQWLSDGRCRVGPVIRTQKRNSWQMFGSSGSPFRNFLNSVNSCEHWMKSAIWSKTSAPGCHLRLFLEFSYLLHVGFHTAYHRRF